MAKKKRLIVRAVVVNDDNLLVMKRKRDGNEFFSFPGGGIEEGEEPEEAVERELLEETSIKATVTKRVYVYYSERFGKQIFFLCKYESGKPKLQANSVEAKIVKEEGQVYDPRWISIEEADKVLLYPEEIKPDFMKHVKNDSFPKKPLIYNDRVTVSEDELEQAKSFVYWIVLAAIVLFGFFAISLFINSISEDVTDIPVVPASPASGDLPTLQVLDSVGQPAPLDFSIQGSEPQGQEADGGLQQPQTNEVLQPNAKTDQVPGPIE